MLFDVSKPLYDTKMKREGFVDVPLESLEDLMEERGREFSKPVNYTALLVGYLVLVLTSCLCANFAPLKVERNLVTGLIPELYDNWFYVNTSFRKETPLTFLDVSLSFSGIEWMKRSTIDVSIDLEYMLKSKVNHFNDKLDKKYEIVPVNHNTEKVSILRENHLPIDREINILMNVTSTELIASKYVLEFTTGSQRSMTVFKAIKIIFLLLVAGGFLLKKNIYVGISLLGLLPVNHFLCHYVLVGSLLMLWINKVWKMPTFGKLAVVAGVIILEIGWINPSLNWMNGVNALVQLGLFISALVMGLNIVYMMPYIVVPMIASILVHLSEFQSTYGGTLLPDVLVISAHGAAIAAMIILDY